jgi:tRNA threonylcarbamoyl adenosine modification protein YeaZ
VTRPLALAIEISNPSSGPRGRIDPAEPAFVAGPGVAIGIFEDHGELLGAEPLSETSRHDDDLMPAIDRPCRRCSAGPRDLTHIAVSVGPGGYTSLRIAIATAKMLAEGTGAKVIAVPSPAVAAWTIAIRTPALVCIASKGETAWGELLPPMGDSAWWQGRGAAAAAGMIPPGAMAEMTACSRQGRSWLGARTPLGIIGAEAVEALAPVLVIADRFLSQAMREAARRIGAEVVEPVFAAESVLRIAEALDPVDPLALAPIYPREPDAVTQWRRLGRNQTPP